MIALADSQASNVCRRYSKKDFEPSSKESQRIGRLPEVARARIRQRNALEGSPDNLAISEGIACEESFQWGFRVYQAPDHYHHPQTRAAAFPITQSSSPSPENAGCSITPRNAFP